MATARITNAPNRIRFERIKPPIVSPITAYVAHNRLSDKSLAFSLVFSSKLVFVEVMVIAKGEGGPQNIFLTKRTSHNV